MSISLIDEDITSLNSANISLCFSYCIFCVLTVYYGYINRIIRYEVQWGQKRNLFPAVRELLDGNVPLPWTYFIIINFWSSKSCPLYESNVVTVNLIVPLLLFEFKITFSFMMQISAAIAILFNKWMWYRSNKSTPGTWWSCTEATHQKTLYPLAFIRWIHNMYPFGNFFT